MMALFLLIELLTYRLILELGVLDHIIKKYK